MLEWHLPDRVLRFERRALLMGIVNVTPDSFSDGGRFHSLDAAVAQGLELVRQGADMLDLGGESTRPGATPVPLEEELQRVVPVVQQLRAATDVPISIDTYKPEVAKACVEAGAHIINDISALRGLPDLPASSVTMAEVAGATGAGVILMHMQGTPQTMQVEPNYGDVVAEVAGFLKERLQAAMEVGIACERVVLDPGIGFGKTAEHNLQLLAHLEEIGKLGRPVCLGVSRKRITASVIRPADGIATAQEKAARRLASSLAAVCHALAHDAAHIVRVHDVEQTRDAVEMIAAIRSTLDR